MTFLTTLSAGPRLHGQLKLARLLEMPEREFERQIQKIEANPLFHQLLDAGIVSLRPYPQAHFAARRFAGRQLSVSSAGLPELLDGRGELVRLIERAGRERFERYFLRDKATSDEDSARACGISVSEARRLRGLIDRLYIQEEFDDSSARPAPSKVFSAVAGIEIDGGQPALTFFHRDVWKGRYAIDPDKRAQLLGSLPDHQARKMEHVLRRLEFLDQRKSTLYRVLEILIAAQSDYLRTGDPKQRKTLTQREVASRVGVDSSALNRLVSNKSLQLPWGLEAPLKSLMPSSKALLLDHLYDLAAERPEFSDGSLCAEIQRLYGARLSRRSITQYRKELSIGRSNKRK